MRARPSSRRSRLPQRWPARACTSSRRTTTWPSATPTGWARCTGSSASRSAWSSRDRRPGREAQGVRGRHHLRHEQRVRLRLPPRQHGRLRRGAVQRGHYFAIVDEVDSILIDEARTPLIISGRADDAQQLYFQFARIVKELQRERDYEVDEAKRTVVPTEEGIQPGRAGARTSRTSTSTSTRTSSTSSRPRLRARSCSSATSTTSSRTAR